MNDLVGDIPPRDGVNASARANTYSTGDGGGAFADRVAGVYLAAALTGQRRPELDESKVTTVSFQTDPQHEVDDLLITSTYKSVELAIACRATPHFVPSDTKTVELVGTFLREMAAHPGGRIAVAVAGRKAEWEQLAKLTDLARNTNDSTAFTSTVAVEGRRNKKVTERHGFLLRMIAATDSAPRTKAEVANLAWEMLRRLHVLMFDLQSPNESDWSHVATLLDRIAAPGSNGIAVRDRLLNSAAAYNPQGAVVDITMIRKNVHSLVSATETRSKAAWELLAQHRNLANGAVRDSIGLPAAGPVFSLPFSTRTSELSLAIRTAAAEGSALIVSGSSGTGKSALTLNVVASLERAEPGSLEAIVLNLRELPETISEFSHLLGADPQAVFKELSASQRVLVVDAADATGETSSTVLRNLAISASKAGLGLVAVTADTAAEVVKAQLEIAFRSVNDFAVHLLADEELESVATAVPTLRGILRNLPEASLLRRVVVLDFLARTGVPLDAPMSEWEAVRLIWSHVVRRDSDASAGSPQAREDTLLQLAKGELSKAHLTGSTPILDPEAIDVLRADRLVAPANVYRADPQFAHDEVRRYATAIHLLRSEDLVAEILAQGAPRWSLSAATLACKALLSDATRNADTTFTALVVGFRSVADEHGPRWADVPIEAVFETPLAYECLTAALDTGDVPPELDNVLRVAEQRNQPGHLFDHALATPIVRYLLDQAEPWKVSKHAFEVLASYLQALVISDQPAGHELRTALRAKLLSHWAEHPKREEGPSSIPWMGQGRRRQRVLDHELIDEAFVESLALMGPDIDDDIERCLRNIAEFAPAFLAPAVDSPLSARALASHDPQFLADMMEAYYINDNPDSGVREMDFGARTHEGRWMRSRRRPTSGHWLGAFWTLFNAAPLPTSVRMLNNFLNHTARVAAEPRHYGGWDDAPSWGEAQPVALAGEMLTLDGQERMFYGDASTWGWYRGLGGPSSCQSALQAMERYIDILIDGGIEPAVVVTLLLQGCENLAVPGLLYGALVRHIEKAGNLLDPFLAQPAVWEMEFSRIGREMVGFRSSTNDERDAKRRQWKPSELAIILVTYADDDRKAELQRVSERLEANGERAGGRAKESTRAWAPNLDFTHHQLKAVDKGIVVEIQPHADILEKQNDMQAFQEQSNLIMHLQARYWIPSSSLGVSPPTADEIAADLVFAEKLLENLRADLIMSPAEGIAHLVRTAIERAAAGETEALGQSASFAIEFALAVAGAFIDGPDQTDEGQYYDMGPDRSIARALPLLLTKQMRAVLSEAGFTIEDVSEAGTAIASKGSLETRRHLARGCDLLWQSACDGSPCVHEIALSWLIDTARAAPIGRWDSEAQVYTSPKIEGDLLSALMQLDRRSIDSSFLQGLIRGLGAAAASNACVSSQAKRLLFNILEIQREALTSHDDDTGSTDGRGTNTYIAARALLQVFSGDSNAQQILAYLRAIRSSADLLFNYLHGLAGAGAEAAEWAEAARSVWPQVIATALVFAHDDPNVYRERTWGSWAAAALLPDPPTEAEGFNADEPTPKIDWVDAVETAAWVDSWVPVGVGERRAVDALIRIVRKLPIDDQATRGLTWVAALCGQEGKVSVPWSYSLVPWLLEIRITPSNPTPSEQWQSLVDALVVAGNSTLAPFST